MPILSDKDKEYLRDTFRKDLVNDVKVILVSRLSASGPECLYCPQTNELLQEVASLSDKIKLEMYDAVADKDKLQGLDVDNLPAIFFARDGERNIRFYGIPAGNEFPNVLEAITHLSKGENALSPQSQEEVRKIDRDLHVRVFVTPT